MSSRLFSGVHVHVHLPPSAEDNLLAPPRQDHIHVYVHGLDLAGGDSASGPILPATLASAKPRGLIFKSAVGIAAVALPIVLVGLLVGHPGPAAPALSRADAGPVASGLAARPQIPAAVLNQLAAPAHVTPPPGTPAGQTGSGQSARATPTGPAAFGLNN